MLHCRQYLNITAAPLSRPWRHCQSTLSLSCRVHLPCASGVTRWHSAPRCVRHAHAAAARATASLYAPQADDEGHALLRVLRLQSAADAMQDFINVYGKLLRNVACMVVLLAAWRSGYFIPVAAIDASNAATIASQSAAGGGFGMLLERMSCVPANVFSVGFTPYMFGSLAAQLWMHISGSARVLSKQGAAGQAVMQGWVQSYTVVAAVVVAALTTWSWTSHAVVPYGSWFGVTAALAAGAVLQVWLAKAAERASLTDGIGVFISALIAADLSQCVLTMLAMVRSGAVPWTSVAAVFAYFAAFALLCVLVNCSQIRLRLQSFDLNRDRSSTVPGAELEGESPSSSSSSAELLQSQSFLPIVLVSNSIMPLLISLGLIGAVSAIPGATVVARHAPWLLPMAMMALTPLCNMLFSMLTVMPDSIAEYLSQVKAGVEEVAPGEATEQYIREVTLHASLLGGLMLACVGVLGIYVEEWLLAAVGFAGLRLHSLSILIVVSALVQLFRKMEANVRIPQLARRLQQQRRLFRTFSTFQTPHAQAISIRGDQLS